VHLTQSKIGYLAFLNQDETILTMHSWSKAAMNECAIQNKPIQYILNETGLWGEAVRQRKPIITNDYAAPSLLKKGIPDGHVAIQKHMNVPIFVNQHIVLVAGVGNKDDDYNENDVQQLTLLIEGMWRLIERKQVEEELALYHEQLEDLVARRTADLTASNHELEAFSYSVSHDLRAPLRALDGFSDALLSDYQEKLDDQGKHYLARIQESSRHMGQLIDDLLKLSRITRQVIDVTSVDLSSLTKQIISELQAQSPERQVEYNVTSDLVVRADYNLIKIALGNLLSNAFKFTQKRDIAHIQFGILEQPGPSVFFVRDDGAGFNMKYADKLFIPFQRLHGISEYPGTGIGLTIVQRIITRHGGRIWPVAAENQGATFYFSLESEK
jgi:signal transduction histidine kinase